MTTLFWEIQLTGQHHILGMWVDVIVKHERKNVNNSGNTKTISTVIPTSINMAILIGGLHWTIHRLLSPFVSFYTRVCSDVFFCSL